MAEPASADQPQGQHPEEYAIYILLTMTAPSDPHPPPQPPDQAPHDTCPDMSRGTQPDQTSPPDMEDQLGEGGADPGGTRERPKISDMGTSSDSTRTDAPTDHQAERARNAIVDVRPRSSPPKPKK